MWVFPAAGLQTTEPYANKKLQETLEKGRKPCLLHLRLYLLVRPVATGYNLTGNESVLWCSADRHTARIKKIQLSIL